MLAAATMTVAEGPAAVWDWIEDMNRKYEGIKCTMIQASSMHAPATPPPLPQPPADQSDAAARRQAPGVREQLLVRSHFELQLASRLRCWPTSSVHILTYLLQHII